MPHSSISCPSNTILSSRTCPTSNSPSLSRNFELTPLPPPPFLQNSKTNRTKSNPAIPKVQNEKLCWTRYKYCAISGEVVFAGDITLNHYPTRDEVIKLAMERAAMFAVENNESWNPFNCSILVKRFRKPNPMFKDPETGEVYE